MKVRKIILLAHHERKKVKEKEKSLLAYPTKKAMKSGVSLQRIWKNKSERLILTFYQKLEKNLKPKSIEIKEVSNILPTHNGTYLQLYEIEDFLLILS